MNRKFDTLGKELEGINGQFDQWCKSFGETLGGVEDDVDEIRGLLLSRMAGSFRRKGL